MVPNIRNHLSSKRETKMKQIIVLTFLSFLSIALFSQAPNAFNYQGVARDLSGAPLPNQLISLRIAILQGSASGIEVYKETHASTTNNLGLFNIQIGMGSPLSSPFASIDWKNGNHFVQIEMDESGGSDFKLIGTSQLLSVPYALYAEDSGDSKWQDNQAGIHYNEGFVGIGAGLPQTQLHIERPLAHPDGATLFLKHGSFGSHFTQNKSGGALHLYQADNTSQTLLRSYGDSYINTTVGNVGIGVREPKSKLQVATGDVYVSNISNGVIMRSPDGQCWRMTISNTGDTVNTLIACPN